MDPVNFRLFFDIEMAKCSERDEWCLACIAHDIRLMDIHFYAFRTLCELEVALCLISSEMQEELLNSFDLFCQSFKEKYFNYQKGEKNYGE